MLRRACQIFFVLVICLPTYSHSAPRIVASIQPISDLVAAVTDGVTTPSTLVPPGASEHHYAMRPSDARQLAQADVIFWVGPQLESFLISALSNISADTIIVPLIDTDGLDLLPLREQPIWIDDNEIASASHVHEDNAIDQHIWLSPDNAVKMVEVIAAVLSDIDPEHQSDYQHNSENAIEQINQTEQMINQQLTPVEDIPYVVSHDAYQYFERTFQLNSLGAITLSPERTPSARHIQALSRIIRENQVVCIFTEPQFDSPLLAVLIENTSVHLGELDPLGEAHEPSLQAYLDLLQQLANSLTQCLNSNFIQ